VKAPRLFGLRTNQSDTPLAVAHPEGGADLTVRGESPVKKHATVRRLVDEVREPVEPPALGDERVAVVELGPFEPFEREDSSGRPAPARAPSFS